MAQENSVPITPSISGDPAIVSGTVASGLAKLGSEEGRREPLADVSANTQNAAAGAKRSHDDALEKPSASVDEIMASAKNALLNIDKHATLARDVELQTAVRTGSVGGVLRDEAFRAAREDERHINRQTLDALQKAADLSNEQLASLEHDIVISQMTRPSMASPPHDTPFSEVKTVEDVDNKHVRQTVREWITSNIPHNKQSGVRTAIFDILWALVPANTRSQMKHTEEAYELGLKKPPGGDVALSDHEGEVNNDILREPHSGSPEAARTGEGHASKKRKISDASSPPPKKKEDDLPDLALVKLDRNSDGRVPVYETCDMVRRKIDAYLRQTGLSNAAFCRAVTDATHISFSGTQLSSFRSKKGYDRGNTSTAFYACYIYFEKLRIKEGKPKSKDRLKMEELWAKEGGFNIETAGHNKAMSMRMGERFTVNKYGQVKMYHLDGRVDDFSEDVM
ncbi:uncharacterized protein BDZ99DRAFT_520310 [Mytilinidion resinicola]|uniref:DUF7726 domain-containing protein n=1 Tax=Mytilinidion resinicola TaxID=574789 RepID=A0A6A6YN67_9PEZI|nr:uncharacterized protein BDZ99DRAFT_520310 [Mytilinidion resinicola]KAF2810230.1 hypothetical protein BDZ99DRAFT_520310 [Mytilinidion resinicola]